jgi:hypothetical protein
MPLVSRTFDQIINFTRTTAATFTGSNGLIQTTPQSVNLLTFTQEFDNAGWVKTNATIAANSIAAPDATNTADTITAGAANATVLQSFSASAVPYTFSVWLRRLTGTGNVEITVDGTTYALVAVTTTWTRFETTLTPVAGTRTAGIRVVTSGDAVYAWGAQLQTGSPATTYTRNFGGRFPPRFDFNPLTLTPRGLLMEEQRSNQLTYSEDITNGVWLMLGTAGASRAANAAVAPDGATTADRYSVGTGTGAWYIANYANQSIVSGQAYTFSVYIKANGLNFVFIRPHNNNGNYGASGFIVSLTDGTITYPSAPTAPGSIGTATNVGNGWWRITATSTANLTTTTTGGPGIWPCNGTAFSTTAGGAPAAFTGDGTSGVFIWGAQIETGAFATSYIPTVASQVTRTGDFSLISDPNFTPWYSQNEGSLLIEAESVVPVLPGSAGLFISSSLSNGPTLTNLTQTYVSDGNWSVIGATPAGTQFALSLPGTYVPNVPAKFGFAYRVNDFVATVNGAAPVADTSGAVPVVSQFNIGSLPNGNQFNGRIRRIVFYPTRLSNAQLQALTT